METPSLVDQYCHGVLRTELGLGTFEAHLGPTGSPPAPGTTFFDTRAGFAVRRWCPPLLGLEPHCPPARYLARRRELGVMEAGRRLLTGTGVSTYLVDTGLPDDLTGPAELAAAGAASAREIVRVELLAQHVADTSGTVDALLANLAEAVHDTAASDTVAFASVAGVRTGLALTPDPPGPGEVRGAAGRWLARRQAGGAPDDPVLLRHLLWSAVASGLPLQLHAGGGDPAPLADFAAATAGLGTDLVLLGTHPHHRGAAELASVHPHVYADVGPATAAELARMLDAAPFGKLLFSSGARALPELHVIGVRRFREALWRVLDGWSVDGVCSRGDAERVARMVAAENARRVYGLE